MIAAAVAVAKPYPGLRPFEADESDVFFGREAQTDELLRRLGRQRFVAVVGTSGSGKSSLVRAGLLPALLGGQLTSAGSHWRTAILRPGGDPTESLALALHGALYPDAPEDRFARDMLDITLRRSSLGLIEAARQARLAAHENLLVVVDQFEELFRFKQASTAAGDQAAAFVHLILEAARQKEVPVNVLITMRSDFLGDCAQFRDLSQAINDGLYLIPRMTRDELRLAITAPAAVYGLGMTPRLVEELLNDVNDDPDQLPVLQHALMRTWHRWCNSTGSAKTIDLKDYQATGGMAEALSRHANEVFDEFADAPAQPNKETVRRLFQCLTEKGPDNREIRRPMRLDELCRVLNIEAAVIRAIIERFREEDRAFLMPPRRTALTEHSVVDIAHESLIRKWDRLREWVDEEAQAATMYRRIAEAARLNEGGETGLWGNPQLQLGLDWREAWRPTAAWAERYHPGFDAAMRFLDRSVEQHQEELRREQESRRRDAAAARLQKTQKRVFVLFLAVVIVAGIILAQYLKNRRLLNETIARRLSTQAALLNSQSDAALGQSVLLAAESILTGIPSVQSDEVLRFGLSLLPKETARLVHRNEVTDVAYSADGRYVVTASTDGTARLMDAAPDAKGRVVWSVNHSSPVNAVAISPNGRYVATGFGPDSEGAHGTARILAVADGRQHGLLSGMGRSTSVAFSPDSRFVAVATRQGSVAIVEAANGHAVIKPVRVCEITSAVGTASVCEVHSVAYSPDGQRIAVGSDDGTVRVLDADTGREIWRVVEHLGERKGVVNRVVYGPNGTLIGAAVQYPPIGSALALGKVHVLNTARGESVFQTLHQGRVTAVAFSPNRRQIASASLDSTARLFDLDSGVEVWRHLHQDSVRSVAFSRDGRLVATGSSDHTARVVEAEGGKEVARLPHDGQVNAVVFSRDNLHIATASVDGTARITAATGSNEVLELKGEDFFTAAFSPDQHYVASGNAKGEALVTDLSSGREFGPFRHDDAVYAVAFSPDGRYFATGSADGSARYFEMASGREIWRLRHDGKVYAVAFSADGRLVITGSEDKKVRLIEAGTGTVLISLTRPSEVMSVALSPSGEQILTGGADKTMRLLDRKGRELVPPFTHEDQVNIVSFSSDGKQLLSASGYTVRVIGASNGKEISRRTYREWINAAGFSPDGRFVAVGGDSGMMRVIDAATGGELSATSHDVKILALAYSLDGRDLHVTSGHAVYSDRMRSQDLVDEACSRLFRNLTRDEWNLYVPEVSPHKTCPALPGP